jgi:protein-S-isoprenylcysteine O-methyltransferase Ste14
MKPRLSVIAFPLAGITLIACWLLFFLFLHTSPNQLLFITGNFFIAIGLLLIILAMSALRTQGMTKDKDDFTSTTTIVRSGIYSIVRHPLYLGWLLMYPSAMLVSQHWLIIILGVVGMLSMYAIAIEADDRLIDKFGSEYTAYIQEVPRFNIVLGLWCKLRS